MTTALRSCVRGPRAAPLLVLALAWSGSASGDEPTIGGHAYVRLETREATERRMLDLLVPPSGEWSTWRLLGPFPYEGIGDLATALEPEAELERLVANGPGPDLTRAYRGKGGRDVHWTEAPGDASRFHDLATYGDADGPGGSDAPNEMAVAYAWNTVRSETARTLELKLGSDDGVRVWVNGRLRVDQDVPRSFQLGQDVVRLELQPGTNHVLAKVAQGAGTWSFQLATRGSLSPEHDALLSYYLDRDFPPSRERLHYEVTTLPVPADIELEVGGLAFLADGTPLAATRRGDVYAIEGAFDVPPAAVRYTTFASGLHEILGLNARVDADGEAVYAVQRGELTRLLDEDGDGRADLYEAFCTDWQVSGNYHEFAFGPEFDDEGNAWVTLNVGFCGSLGKALVPWRGAALKIDRSGRASWVCDGLRSPNGIGRYRDGTMFYVDNQGDYVATNKLSVLAPGSWHGHPASLRWREDVRSPDERPPLQAPAVWFPYEKMGQSAADLALDASDGRFGPFAGQFFVGDQLAARILRVHLEQVDGVWQGACFPFLSGLGCGVNRLEFAPDGSLFAGETDRGWTSIGRNRFGLERVRYTGVPPFEIRSMSAREDGFELEFTADVDAASAGDPASYALKTYTYEYHADYGAPEVDEATLPVRSARVLDRRRVRLEVRPLRQGYVHELKASGVRDAHGEPLLHDDAYYTMTTVPGARAAAAARRGQALPRVLFFTHAAGFRHPVATRAEASHLSFAELRLTEAAAERYEVVCTQDPAALSADSLERFAAVVFFTSGELPVDAAGRDALFAFVERGGGFVGVHSATDTWYEEPRYRELIGAAFAAHPWVGAARVRVEDATHPAVSFLPAALPVDDEIYTFRDFRRHPLRVLLSLDPDSVDPSKGDREDGDYALAWWKDHGRGRMTYTALGHGEGTWRDRRFLRHLVASLDFVIAGKDHAAPPPAGARVLIGPDGVLADGAMLHRDGAAPQWRTVDGGLEVTGGGDLRSVERFGDGLYHVEFLLPKYPLEVTGQARANSGVYLASRYEVQVLDSFGVELGLGDCAAVYGKHVASRHAAREPERWQSYDVRFRAPRFEDGRKVENARLSLWWNGLLVHDDVEIDGPTGGAFEEGEGADGFLLLQDHGCPVRYRNVWYSAGDG